MVSIRQIKRLSQGASLIEFSIAIPLFLFFLIAIIDIGRYWAAKNILQAGVTSAANLAAQLDGIQIDTAELIEEYNAAETSDDRKLEIKSELARFTTARNQVISEAINLPTSSLISLWSQPGAIVLLPWVVPQEIEEFPSASIAPESGAAVGAILVRPTELFKRAQSDYSGNSLGMVQYQYDWNSELSGASSSVTGLLKEFPIVVYNEAHFKWLMPLMPSSTVIRSKAYAYRERVWSGTLPEVMNPPEAAPTWTPQNTPTNTKTPTNTPTNTGTPTETATPTITNTPTPSNTATATPTGPTATPTNTLSPTITFTPSNTPTASNTPTETATPTATTEILYTPVPTATCSIFTCIPF